MLGKLETKLPIYTTANSSGEFSIPLDLSRLEAGQRFTVRVRDSVTNTGINRDARLIED